MRFSIKRRFTARSGVAALALGLVLSGCEQLGITPAESAPNRPAEAGGTSVNRDVERPDVFSVSEKALWDGRPSLGGVWVAYPANIDPERVVIRNIDNGKTVIGALFRRERENPGPKIQLSSDAAVALGVVAGTPTEISIVVLRREEVEVEVAAAPETATADENMTIPPRRVEQPAPAPAADAHPAAPATAAASLATIVEQTLADVPAPGETAESGEAQDATATESRPALFRLRKPFIQIETFDTEEAANALVEELVSNGVLAQVQANEAENPSLWRVFAGPFRKRTERTAQLRIIKGLGYTDAFYFK